MMSMYEVKGVAIMETCTADLLQHAQNKSDRARNMKTWEGFPAAMPDFEPDFSQAVLQAQSPPPVFLFPFSSQL